MEAPATRRGLDSATAAARLREEGPNDLDAQPPHGLLHALFEIVREPMTLLLVGCGAIYLLLGDPHEAALLLGFVALVAAIDVFQERKTERAVEALRRMSSPRALVIRDGERRRIAGRDVVRGDLIVLSEGDRVPADAVVLEAAWLQVDESLLTGESVPVRKRAGDRPEDACPETGEEGPFVFGGTLVTRGQGLAEVRAAGPRTRMGRIGSALATTEPGRSPLQRETTLLVRRLALGAAALCVLVTIVFGLGRGDWLGALLAGLTLAMAILPNEFPAVLAIFLALGAWRLSHRRVLTRRVAAIEALGSATVLCVDKTGTLTENRMTVRRLLQDGAEYEVPPEGDGIPEAFHEVVEYGILASQRDPFDPMERAFQQLGRERLEGTGHLHPSWTLVRQYPLSDELLALSHVWRSPDGADAVIAAKGAPEAIADLCHLPDRAIAALRRDVERLAGDGLRVLGVARARFRAPQLPAKQHDFDFELVGLVGLADPIRAEVPAALRHCREAGVRVVMLTGDHPRTARAIASTIALPLAGGVVTGQELDALDDDALRERVGSVNVFARIAPEQKLRLVRAFRARGEVVAMTGDGINDAPALRAADIGIAMGRHGTDVAREAASLVALDDDFGSITAAIRAGRRIFDNLRSAMAYLLAVHVPIAGLTLLPVLFGLPLLLHPVHVASLHLLIEPACSVVFELEPEDPAVMRRPPRRPDEPLFGLKLVGPALLQGACVLAIVFALFVVSLWRGKGPDEARALAFTTLIVANLLLILTNRSWHRTIAGTLRAPNPALWWVLAGGVAMLAAILAAPPLRAAFRLGVLHADDLALCAVAGVVSVAWFEALKVLRNGRPAPPPRWREA